MKKIFALVLALMLVLGMTSAFAATITKNPADLNSEDNASITVTLPTVPAGTVANNTYKIYKVFGATVSGTNIAYTLAGSHTDVPAGFSLTRGYVEYTGEGEDGNLTDADIAAIKAYKTEADLVATVTTTASDTSFTVSGLDYGYYFIDTTVGTVVTINSTNPSANVADKNEIPPLNKKITGASSYDEAGQNAIAQVGTDVEYTVSLTIEKGAKNYSFHDLMDDGLEFNEDVVVYTENPGVNGTNRSSLGKLTKNVEYTEDFTAGGSGEYAYTFKIDLDDDYVAENEGQTLYFVYSAKVTNAALTTDPENNTAWLDYGQTPGENHTPKKTVHTYSAKVEVYKYEEVTEDTTGAVLDQESGKYYKPLAGAGFILKNSSDKYYKFVGEDSDGNPVVEWVDSEDDADEYFSQENGSLNNIFKGLPADTYTLIEKTVPASYTKAADQTITINAADSEDEHKFEAVNLEKLVEVENKQGSLLPSTGGIGTTIFYIGGSILVLAAVILLVTKRRMGSND